MGCGTAHPFSAMVTVIVVFKEDRKAAIEAIAPQEALGSCMDPSPFFSRHFKKRGRANRATAARVFQKVDQAENNPDESTATRRPEPNVLLRKIQSVPCENEEGDASGKSAEKQQREKFNGGWVAVCRTFTHRDWSWEGAGFVLFWASFFGVFLGLIVWSHFRGDESDSDGSA